MALKENIRVEGKRDIQTKVMTTFFALFAEVERDLIICAGDVALGKAIDPPRRARLDAMPGRKVLVVGNHEFGPTRKPTRAVEHRRSSCGSVPDRHCTGA